MRTTTFVGLLACVLLGSCSHKEEPGTGNRLPVVDSLPRLAITFILGRDENPRNPYYSLADDYYRLSDSEKTEIVIDTIYSLTGVLNYLAHNPPANGRPWGLINLVSHGNEFIDLSVTISPSGPRASEESIRQALRDTALKPLPASIVDNMTMVSLHGCAVGKNSGLLQSLAAAFGGVNAPVVRASKLFEYYGNAAENNNPMFIRHYYARAWYAYFHPDSIVSDSELASRFRSRYPADAVNWDEAVSRYHPNTPAEAYNLRMMIPVVWEDLYTTKANIPDVRAKVRQDEWVEHKPEFQTLMSRTGIPRDYFQIKFYSATYTKDTATVYGLRVKARAGVVCVIQPLISEAVTAGRRFLPVKPAPADTQYFGFAAK